MSAADHSEVGLHRRLGFARYLLQLASQQQKDAEPRCYAALLTFHDALEVFLAAACAHQNVGKREMSIAEYLNQLEPRVDGGLRHRLSILRLNGARVQLKHQGVWPHKLDLVEFGDVVRAFFRDNALPLFGFEIDEASLVSFVEPESARRAIQRADVKLAEGEYEETAAELGTAFALLREHYRFEAPSGMRTHLALGNLGFELHGLARHIEQLESQLFNLQRDVVGLKLGVDPADYEAVLSSLPIVALAHSGSPQIRFRAGQQYTLEALERAKTFIVDVALKLSFDFGPLR